MVKVYQTERLLLKVLGKSDAELVLDYYQRNRDFLREWEPLWGDRFYKKDYQKTHLSKDWSNIKNGTMLRLWLFKKDDQSRVIGSVAFSNIIRGALLACHLGYKLDKDEINKGYITEAIQKGIDVIFNDYRLHRIEVNIMPKNLASLRVAKKLGFKQEGIAYKYLKINGQWEDHIKMVLLNEKL